MILIFCLQIIVNSAIIEVDGHDVVIPTVFDLGFLRRFPVTFDTNNSQSVPGYASISLGQTRNMFQVYDGYDLRDLDRIDARSWHTQGSGGPQSALNFSINLRVGVNISDEFHPTALIGGSFNSAFARTVGSFILTPTTNQTGQLIVRPLDPRIYAYNGEIFYATRRVISTGHIQRSMIPVSVRIVPRDQYLELGSPTVHTLVATSSFVDCTLEKQDRYLIVPDETFDQFLDELDRLGVVHEYDGETDSLMIRNVTDEVVGSLPIIQCLVMSDEGLQVSIQLLSPRNYLLPLRTDPSIRFVLMNTGENQCDLPPGLINRMFVHMDVSHNRIGFGEPLNAF